MPAPVLLFGYGNPSRGDDGLGPALLDRVASLRPAHPQWPEVELLTDYQLQIEHVLDLQGRSRVLFVDAEVGADAPFRFSRVRPGGAWAFSTHVVTPQRLLAVYRDVVGADAPATYLLGIRGRRFELGASLSDEGAADLALATAFTARWLARQARGRAELRAGA